MKAAVSGAQMAGRARIEAALIQHTHTHTPPPPPPLPTAYGIETFTDMMDIRSILPLHVDEEEEEEGEGGVAQEGSSSSTRASGGVGGVTTTEGGGLLASRGALRTMAPRTAAFLKKFRALNEALVEVIEDYNMVSFLAASSREVPSLQRLVAACDKANGFVPTYSKRGAQEGVASKGGEGVEEGEEEEEEEEREED